MCLFFVLYVFFCLFVLFFRGKALYLQLEIIVYNQDV